MLKKLQAVPDIEIQFITYVQGPTTTGP